MNAKELLNYLVQLENEGKKLDQLTVTSMGEEVTVIDHDDTEITLE